MSNKKFKLDVKEYREGDWGAEFKDYYGDKTFIGEVDYKGTELLAIGCYPVSPHMTREQCEAIWPLIKRFAETGTIKDKEGS